MPSPASILLCALRVSALRVLCVNLFPPLPSTFNFRLSTSSPLFRALCASALPLFFCLCAPLLAQDPKSKPSSPDEQLQQAITKSGNDRAALVRNLQDYLRQYPESAQRPRIYRALVESCMQLHDDSCATNYSERLVALSPDDIPMTVLTIQLLQRTGDEAGLRRAVNYATRVLDYVDRAAAGEKSPRLSQEVWDLDRKRDRTSVLSMRGSLELKLKDSAAAQKDFEISYAILPSATAAEQLAEIAEAKKDSNVAILEYSRAFALADANNSGSISRREIRQKLGNVWRLAHGSDDGLGEYLLRIYDEVLLASTPTKPKKNGTAREPADFTLRTAPDGAPFPLKNTKGKILVINFWATWCGPCHELEPLFAHVALSFHSNPEVLFLSANCDDDESLAVNYLKETKPRTTAVFADGLDKFYTVNSFPTVLVIGREGKVFYRTDGFQAETIESYLSSAVESALVTPSPAPAITQ
jgi:thiol-disulfide isomerase/thioredoxin